MTLLCQHTVVSAVDQADTLVCLGLYVQPNVFYLHRLTVHRAAIVVPLRVFVTNMDRMTTPVNTLVEQGSQPNKQTGKHSESENVTESKSFFTGDISSAGLTLKPRNALQGHKVSRSS